MTMLELFVVSMASLLFLANAQEEIEEELVAGSNQFGYDLSNKLSADASNTNIWLSPFCITSCFSLIYPGAHGDTQTQISNVMHYPSCSSSQCTSITQQFFSLQNSIETTYNGSRQHFSYSSIIGIANKIFTSNSIQLKQTYIDALDSEPSQESFITYDFDFSSEFAAQIINNWVYDNTDGLIDSIVGENEDISGWVLAALNAIYLNATFSQSFDSDMTSVHTFYSDKSRQTTVSECHLMHQIEYFSYYSDDEYQFVKISFDDWNDALFVLFALPKSTETELITDKEYIETALSELKSYYVALALPKLSIEEMYDLGGGILQGLGMTDAFDGNEADFSGMSDTTALVIDAVKHKTMIRMDESGLVAAAVTIIGMVALSGPISHPNPVLFKADHPFQMFIIDGAHDNVVLFMGRIGEPGIPEDSETPTYDESTDPVWEDVAVRNDFIPAVIVVGFVLWFVGL